MSSFHSHRFLFWVVVLVLVVLILIISDTHAIHRDIGISPDDLFIDIAQVQGLSVRKPLLDPGTFWFRCLILTLGPDT